MASRSETIDVLTSRNGQLSLSVVWVAALALAGILVGGEEGILLQLALAVAPLAIYLCISFPLFWCLLFVSLSYFRLHEAYQIPPTFKPVALTTLMLFASSLWWLVGSRRAKTYLTPELKLLGWLYLLVSFGLVAASNRELSFDAWYVIFMWAGPIGLLLAWMMQRPADLQVARAMIVASGMAVAVVAVHNFAYGIDIVTPGPGDDRHRHRSRC